MIEDQALFGYARYGKVDDVVYPSVIASGNGINYGDSDIEILGDRIPRQILYPAKIKQEILETDKLVIIPNGAELVRKPKDLVRIIMDIHSRYGFSKLIMISGISDPYSIPALVYLGISFFDSSILEMEGKMGYRFTPFGIEKADHDVSSENAIFISDMMHIIQRSISDGTLRELIEKAVISSKAAEMVRIADYSYYQDFESVFPVRTPYIKANTIEDLYRPDLIRYRNYISESYVKPDADIALILPCSAKKPYSRSKSHQKVIGALGNLRRFIHEVIVTSPIGIVPRDLEETYPARFYDIPVIGLWYEDEKIMMKRMMSSYMGRNRYRKVIAFIPEDLDFITEAIPYPHEVIEFKSSNLQRLREVIQREIAGGKAVNQKVAKYNSILRYQFGEWILPLVSGYTIRRNYNQDMIVKDGKILFVYNENLGKFTINKASADMFIKNGKFLVEIDDFKPTSNVYAMGVVDATEDIRQEDEVVLVHSGEVRGVGIAKMPARAMIELKKGIAVKVR
ncbi:conserved hypothetical protein [Thermoplasma acidophilum]|uniref:Archaeosine synthase subunit alpha n=1 Tax=Thermoplasma acidophilum (strain ATCC 25905 / DSM 1728 / JCM 9062 / NBRC 15155 / AMRC-C165) TaxID=273075 RepID=ARCSA_THEAC|nr:DUF5591 domain-containing protein [Thermoplasma acidophilum]Q9HJP3.1 RecName: Full=Archaeosine synthase subunit alpha; AltName: Full=Archaeosine synthase, lysine transferase subunit [Thermoplasma acidophilum DSM 1728]MCY0852273.1 DUF5591 domain-containing protein [Thermoplasma acidophilum]CAC12053.1 conserved hypothetical protein [Thermoplasma acidophilum]